MTDEAHLREALVRAMRDAVADGLSNGTSGNASARLDDDHVLITPSSVPPDELTAASMVVIDGNGSVVAGNGLAPSTEVAMHLAVYSVAPRARAVMHTHSPFATAVGCVGDELPAVHYDIVGLGGPVRVAPYVVFGSRALAGVCATALEGRTAALLANHGAIAVGRNVSEAYGRAAKLEWLSQLYWNARQIGTPRLLTDAQLDEVREQSNRYRYGTPSPTPP